MVFKKNACFLLKKNNVFFLLCITIYHDLHAPQDRVDRLSNAHKIHKCCGNQQTTTSWALPRFCFIRTVIFFNIMTFRKSGPWSIVQKDRVTPDSIQDKVQHGITFAVSLPNIMARMDFSFQDQTYIFDIFARPMVYLSLCGYYLNLPTVPSISTPFQTNAI